MSEAKLFRYKQKRDFKKTEEPKGIAEVAPFESLRFVIQKHAASRLHFDLRLEVEGTFRSWALPKGPSLDPDDRRLAVQVEDHPLDYGDFEGTIPKGQYGGGTVMLWDRGYWAPEAGYEKIGPALEKGELKFVMEGERVRGSWVMVRMRGDAGGGVNWLLIKHRDETAVAGKAGGPSGRDRSVASRRTMAEIASGKGRAATPFMTANGAAAEGVWRDSRDGGARSDSIERAKAKGAIPRLKKVGSLPHFIEPQLAKPTGHPPSGPGWAHEIKFDGYRMQLRVDHGAATLKTRKGLDWSRRFPEIIASGGRLRDGIYDGEVVALDDTGAPNFASLQAALANGATKALVLFVFDLLFQGRDDVRPLPLSQRRARLRRALTDPPDTIRYVDQFLDAGDAVLRSACRMQLEGIVSKRLDAPYRSGRVEAWTKSKCRAGHEVVIGGYTLTKGAFRSLVVGVHREGELVAVGRVGTGFGRNTAAEILPKLQALETDRSPFSDKRVMRRTDEIRWVRPKLVAEVEYEGFTADGMLRQAAFKGLRADKAARDVETVEPAPPTTRLAASWPTAMRTHAIREGDTADVMDVALSHAGKPLWPDDGDGRPVTKRDLARYLEAVGDWMIRHMRGRPCSIVRFPDGIAAEERFFQRHVVKGQSHLLSSVTVRGDRKPYLQFDRPEALIAGAQICALEFHPWNCKPFEPEQPGRLVFDLDPAPDVPFERVIVAARELRGRLKDLGLVGFCKTTGGKGLHVVTPVRAGGIQWPEAKAFASNVCAAMAGDSPERYLINMAKAQRTGRIFLDYLRNDRLATAVAPLSTRGRPGAPVSMPLDWTQIKKGLDPMKYTLRTVPRLLQGLTAWQDYGEGERSLAAAVKRLGKT